MGRRREQRLVLTLPCKISGIDNNNNPFAQDCETVDMSRNGCRIRWVYCLRGIGDTVEIQYGKEKGKFKVSWLGEEGSRREGQVGLRSVDNKYIWGVALASPKPDDYVLPEELAPPPPPPLAEPIKVGGETMWTGEDRRSYPRYRCPGEIEVTDQAIWTTVRGMLSDISQGGCYVDILSPLASDSRVRVRVKTTDAIIESEGLVRASDPSMGMGIQFTEMSPENRERLHKLVAGLGRQFTEEVQAPAAAETSRYELPESAFIIQPPAPAPPSPLAAALESQTFDTPVVLEALLELLYTKGVITRQEFQHALEKASSTARRS